ncbi:exopolyphosphatase [Mangrovitalea sediminis]|uniref:exopolyphosphatase n=1 Tax=Mangrovitalea sediminis TaxID=1982043 RepID=UPI0022282CCA|nr:exopolyphosphatase [Mangrovitalea sediminis]
MTGPQSASNSPELLAAIDMGSNSFHMVIARLVQGEIRTLEKMGEKVQLAAGLNPGNRLTEEAQLRALECLSRFAQRLGGMPPEAVQVVGTNALRVARNTREFLHRAEQALGYPVSVIAGREEARLIYLGVSHTLADDAGRRLVIDIGGGSTEFIIGERFEAQELESLHMGCISFRDRYFSDGKITRKQLDQAITHAAQELLNIQRRYQRIGWNSCVGSSGSIKALSVVLNNLKLGNDITLAGLKELRQRLLDLGHVDKLSELGVRADRQNIFPAGFAILFAAFESLQIERLAYADGALREGLLYDMVGRIQHEDVRERSIQALQERYHIDTAQAAAVEQTAIHAYQQVAHIWGLDSPDDENLLRWASRVHEIGLAISHSQYHKHGAYLVRFSDMAGFSQELQQALATLVRGHRRKYAPAIFEGMEQETVEKLMRQGILLRLAVLLQHARNQEPPPPMTLKAGKRNLELQIPARWLEDRPLTRADLNNERDYLSKIDFTLSIKPT